MFDRLPRDWSLETLELLELRERLDESELELDMPLLRPEPLEPLMPSACELELREPLRELLLEPRELLEKSFERFELDAFMPPD